MDYTVTANYERPHPEYQEDAEPTNLNLREEFDEEF